MVNKKRFKWIIFIVVMGCLIMAWIDAVVSPKYAVKSAIKVIFFALLPIVYTLYNRQISFHKLFCFNKNSLKWSVFLGAGVYILIFGAYLILRPYFDFSKVTMSLQNNIGVNKNNFIFVALYISIINSLLEEFFFRGISFLTLKKVSSRKVAYLFSAISFALYHIAIVKGWFSVPLLILITVSIFLAGLFFNWLDEKNGNILISWVVHMSANLAINTIGLILFGIL